MILKISFSFLLSVILFFGISNAQADTLDKQSAGFRYTDNVYLLPTDKTADFYFFLSSRFQFFLEERILRLKLDYADYTKESDNDYVGLSLSTKLKNVGASTLNGKLFHKNYVNENAATTDNGFTHTGAALDLERAWASNSNFSFTGGASYETRFFHDFGGRNDHQLMALVDIDFNSNPKIAPYAYADFGVVLSSFSAYSTVFFDLGGGLKGPVSKSLSWIADLDIRSVSYMNRTVDQTMTITKRRGTTQNTNITENEHTQCLTVGGGLSWKLEKSFDFETRMTVSEQNSNNPNFAYQNNEFFLSLIYTP